MQKSKEKATVSEIDDLISRNFDIKKVSVVELTIQGHIIQISSFIIPETGPRSLWDCVARLGSKYFKVGGR